MLREEFFIVFYTQKYFYSNYSDLNGFVRFEHFSQNGQETEMCANVLHIATTELKIGSNFSSMRVRKLRNVLPIRARLLLNESLKIQ